MTMFRTAPRSPRPSASMWRALAWVGLTPPDGGPGAGVPDADEPTAEAGAPALSALTLMPSGWPAPPVPAVLLRTSESGGGNLQSADYLTAASAEEVLAAYEAALAPYEAVREDHGVGEMVWGTVGDVAFQVTTRPGGFSVLFAGQ